MIGRWEQLTTELEAQKRALGRGAGRAAAIQPLVSQLIELVRRDGDRPRLDDRPLAQPGRRGDDDDASFIDLQNQLTEERDPPTKNKSLCRRRVFAQQMVPLKSG